MFSYETEHIIRKVQNKILGERDSITLRSILSAPIHNAIKVYFRADVANKHGSPKRFHTEHSADIDNLKSEIDLLLPSNFTFDKDTFLSLLTDAVHFQFNYLCRPRWTMKEFFFHNSSTLTVPELKQGFNYFSAYDYYPKVLFPYLQKKNITQIDSTTFDDIILRIDKLVLGDATFDDFATLLRPLSDFIRYGRDDDNDAIPEHALTLFFVDKKFEHISSYLESTLQRERIEQITIDKLRDYLSDMPVEDTPKKELTDNGTEEQPVIEEPFEEEPEIEGIIDETNKSTIPPLELLIEEDERKRFIRKLFNGDAAYFDVVVQTLNNISSWKEASLYIDEIFLVNGVDPYSTDAVNFTDKVYTRFNQKSMYK